MASFTQETAANQVRLLTPLPVATPAITVPSGVVKLFRNNDFNSENITISTKDYAVGERHAVSRPLNDQAAFAAFNLPLGVVMTLMEHNEPRRKDKPFADYSGCGRCIDFVGSGRTVCVDLWNANMNDCISQFLWREVDLSLGAVELFDDTEFRGSRTTIFLGEWAPRTVHDIGAWWLQDQVSSVRWTTLNDRQKVTLFEHVGEGREYANIKGWGTVKENWRFSDVGFNDLLTSFKWEGLLPVDEKIKPFVITGQLDNETGITDTVDVENDSNQVQTQTLEFRVEKSQEVTVTTNETYVIGVSTTITQKSSVEAGPVTSDFEFSVTMKYDYSISKEKSTTQKKSMSLAQTKTVNVSPKHRMKASLEFLLGKPARQEYETTAERWYKEPVLGGLQDPLHNNDFKRVEKIRVSVNGNLKCQTILRFKEVPL